MKEKEILQALQVLDEFLSETDEEFDYNITPIPTDNVQTSGNLVFKRFKSISPSR